MSQIKGLISEVSQINDEIKRINTQKKKLQSRKKVIEAEILNYLENNEQTGVKYRGTCVVAQAKKKRHRRKKKEKENNVSRLLEKYGLRNNDKIVHELLEAVKGDPVDSKVLTFTKY
jgi:hypothetical protein